MSAGVRPAEIKELIRVNISSYNTMMLRPAYKIDALTSGWPKKSASGE